MASVLVKIRDPEQNLAMADLNSTETVRYWSSTLYFFWFPCLYIDYKYQKL